MSTQTLSSLPQWNTEEKYPYGAALSEVQLSNITNYWQYFEGGKGFNTDYNREENYPEQLTRKMQMFLIDHAITYGIDVLTQTTSHFVPISPTNTMEHYVGVLEFEPGIIQEASMKGPLTGLNGSKMHAWRQSLKRYGFEARVSFQYGDDRGVGQWKTSQEFEAKTYDCAVRRLKNTWDTIHRIPNPWFAHLDSKSNGLDLGQLVEDDTYKFNILGRKDGMHRMIGHIETLVKKYRGDYDSLDICTTPGIIANVILRPENRDFYIVGTNSDGPRNKLDLANFVQMQGKTIMKVDELKIKHDDYPLLENVVVRGSAWILNPKYPETGLPSQNDTTMRIPDFETGKLVEITPSDCIESSGMYDNGKILNKNTLIRLRHPKCSTSDLQSLTGIETFHMRTGGEAKVYISERIKAKDIPELYKRTHAFYEFCVKNSGGFETDVTIWKNFISTVNAMRNWVANGKTDGPTSFPGTNYKTLQAGEVEYLKGLKNKAVLSTLWSMHHWTIANIEETGDKEIQKHVANIKAWIDHMLSIVRASKHIFKDSLMTTAGTGVFKWDGNEEDYASLDALLQQTYLNVPTDAYLSLDEVKIPIASVGTPLDLNLKNKKFTAVAENNSIQNMCFSKTLFYENLSNNSKLYITADVVRLLTELSIGHSSEQLLALIYLGGDISEVSTVRKLTKSRVGYPWKDLLIRPNEHYIADGAMFLGRGGTTLETLMGFEDTRVAQSYEGNQYMFKYTLCLADLVKFPKNFADVPIALLKAHLAGGSAVLTKKNPLTKKCINETLNTEDRPELFVVHVPLSFELGNRYINISNLGSGVSYIPDWPVYDLLWNLGFVEGQSDIILPYQHKYKRLELERDGKVGAMCYLPTPEEYQTWTNGQWITVNSSTARNRDLTDKFMSEWFTGMILK